MVALLAVSASANAGGGSSIKNAPTLPMAADVPGSTYNHPVYYPPPDYWKVHLNAYDQLMVDFAEWYKSNGGVDVCLLDPSITDNTLEGANCTAEAYSGSNGKGELKYIVSKSGNWTLRVTPYTWCCGDSWGYEIEQATAFPTDPSSQLPDGGYPWSNAVCRYPQGGIKCKSPSGEPYNWGYKVGKDWQLFNPKTGNFAYRNCTDYVAWRLRFKSGYPFSGDARKWASEAESNRRWAVTSTPSVNDIAWWDSYDHVAVVMKARAKTGEITVAEYNWPVKFKGKMYYGMYGTRHLFPGEAGYPDAFLHHK